MEASNRKKSDFGENLRKCNLGATKVVYSKVKQSLVKGYGS